ncbi:hypothetical protein ACOWKX_07905 [Helicobacter pylori]
MLLDYDFLLLLNDESGNPTRYYYLLQDFEKDFVAREVAQNKTKRFVKEIIGSEKASKTKNSAIEISSTKAFAMKNETIGSGDLKKVCEKIKSALPFGIISAFKPFKDAFYRDFNDNEQKLLIGMAKSGCIQSSSDKLAQLKTRLLYWQDKSVKVDWDKPILIKDFFKGNNYLYRRFCFLLGKHFMDRFLKNNAKASVKDFMFSKEFVAKYRYTPKQNTERAKKLQSYLENKRDFIGFVQTLNSLKDNPQDPFLPNEEMSFLVFSNEPTIVFNLRDYLLVLAQIFNQQAICYCESKCPLKQLEKISASLSKDIVIAIKQVEKLELNYALIDNIQHNTLDDTLNFTFIIGDSLSVQSLYVTFHLVIDMDRPMSEQFLNHIGELGSFESRERVLECVRLSQAKLIVETPREALKNAQLSQIEEILTGCIFNGAYRLQNNLKGNRHGNFK